MPNHLRENHIYHLPKSKSKTLKQHKAIIPLTYTLHIILCPLSLVGSLSIVYCLISLSSSFYCACVRWFLLVRSSLLKFKQAHFCPLSSVVGQNNGDGDDK